MKLTHGQEVAHSRILGSPYVIITGDRQTGKTTAVLDIAKSWYYGDTALGVEHLYVICHNHDSAVNMKSRFDQMVANQEMSIKGRIVKFQSVKFYNSDMGGFRGHRNIGVIVDEAGYITDSNDNNLLELIAQRRTVTKFVMISSPGPGQFFSEILETCTNHGPWLRPLFVHHELECTDMDREYFKNTQFCSDPELLDLFNQQQDINQRIQRILTK